MMDRWGQVTKQPELKPVSSGAELLSLREQVDRIHVSPGVQAYILALVQIGPVLIWGPAALWLWMTDQPGFAIFLMLWGALVVGVSDNVVKALFVSRGAQIPALLAFLNFIRAQRQVLSEADWIAKFGRVHGRIAEQILPRFADAEIEEARRIGSSDPALLYLPPEARAP